MLLFESFNEIEAICKKYGIYNYTINSDGTIDVDGNVSLAWNELKILPLKFREVTGNFSCSDNNLTTLIGVPLSVGDGFYCYQNKLTTLEGAPQSVGGHFSCSKNNLTTLEGAPQSVGGHFSCSENNLTTLEGGPQSIGGNLNCSDNPLESVRKLFPDDTTFYKLYKEWEFFAGGNKIYKHRFLEAMLDIGKELPESIQGYEYI